MTIHNRYKDALPEKTIYRLREILRDMNILTVEKWIDSPDEIYSLRVAIAGSDIGTNGKGGTEALALASAYGEFLERLQNIILYNVFELSPDIQDYGGFFFAPDEKYMTLDEVMQARNHGVHLLLPENRLNPWTVESGQEVSVRKMKEWFPDVAEEKERELLKAYSYLLKPQKAPGDFIMLPFYDVRAGKSTAVPLSVLRIHHGSNGMAAGNTLEEALVQGISEVLERFAEKEIIFNKLTPPTIPDDFLRQYPSLYNLIRELEVQGNFRIIVKDYSLGIGLPVVATIVVDLDTQGYYVRSGAHPSFEVALERCLTETLQGKPLAEFSKWYLSEFSSEFQVKNPAANYRRIVCHGIGKYPGEFFGSNSSYQFAGFNQPGSMSNQGMLQHLSSMIIDLGYDLLIRDVSFLGFPSVHIVVPGMSGVHIADQTTLALYRGRKEARNCLWDLNTISDEDLTKLVDFICERQPFPLECENLGRLLGYPVKPSFPWSSMANQEFLTRAFYRLGRHEEAYRMMNLYIEKMTRNDVQLPRARNAAYYRCVRDYLFNCLQSIDQATSQSQLKMVYHNALVEEIFEDWGDPKRIFSLYGNLNCWNCESCAVKAHCCQNLAATTHKRLKEKYVASDIRQEAVGNLFMWYKKAGSILAT